MIPHVNQGGLRTQGNPRIRDWVCRSTNSGSSICPSQSSFTQGRYNEVEHTASLVARPRSPLRRGDRPLLGVLIIRYSPRSVAPRRTRCFGPSSPHPARVSRTLVAGTTRPRQAPRSSDRSHHRRTGPYVHLADQSDRGSSPPQLAPVAIALRCVARSRLSVWYVSTSSACSCACAFCGSAYASSLLEKGDRVTVPRPGHILATQRHSVVNDANDVKRGMASAGPNGLSDTP